MKYGYIELAMQGVFSHWAIYFEAGYLVINMKIIAVPNANNVSCECELPALGAHVTTMDGRSSFVAGETAHFGCSDGYELTGSRDVTCLPGCVLDRDPPECEG